MLVPPTLSWTSRATMPLVSVTMAWASETPGVSTPPTVVKAPNLRTSRRLSGLNMVSPLTVWWTVGKPCRIGGRDSTVERTSNEASGFRVHGDEPARGGRRHLRPDRPPSSSPLRLYSLRLWSHLEDGGAARGLHGRGHRVPRLRRLPPTGRPDRPPRHALGATDRSGGRDPRSHRCARARARPRPRGGNRSAHGRLPPDARRAPCIDRAPRGSRVEARHPPRAGRALRAHPSGRRAAPRVSPDHHARGASQWRRHPPPRRRAEPPPHRCLSWPARRRAGIRADSLRIWRGGTSRRARRSRGGG